MEQLHKKFTNSKVRALITRYLKKEIKKKIYPRNFRD